MTQTAFNALPYLLRRRAVPGFEGVDIRPLVEDQTIRTVQVSPRAAAAVGSAHGSALYYVRASLAPLLGLTMEWSELDAWPALVRRWHLLRAGLYDEDLSRLLKLGLLTERLKHGPRRFHKTSLAALVGRSANEKGQPHLELNTQSWPTGTMRVSDGPPKTYDNTGRATGPFAAPAC